MKYRLKIGVNGRFLTKPFTGIGQHTKYLFHELAKQYPDVQFCFVTPENAEFDFPQNIQINVLPEKFPGTAGMRKTFWEQQQVPQFFQQQQVDLVHFPYPSNPWKKFSKPVCVTVHDTIPWTLPDYRKSISTRLYQNKCRSAIHKADHIFTVSQTTAHEIQDLYKVPTEKMSVSYNAPAPHYFDALSIENRKKVLAKFQLTPDHLYLLYVGGYDKRKNTQTILKVFQEKIAPFYAIDLVMAGGKSLHDALYGSYDLLTRYRNENSLKMNKGKIILTGFVDEYDLPVLYQSAFAFLNLSEKEGCNLPLLEAAASKVPMITSDLPVHHEMVEDVALFCSPHDEAMLAYQLTQLLDSPDFYQKQKQKAEQYILPFSWQKTADEVMKVYQKLL